MQEDPSKTQRLYIDFVKDSCHAEVLQLMQKLTARLDNAGISNLIQSTGILLT